jgi:hypothetical protein
MRIGRWFVLRKLSAPNLAIVGESSHEFARLTRTPEAMIWSNSHPHARSIQDFYPTPPSSVECIRRLSSGSILCSNIQETRSPTRIYQEQASHRCLARFPGSPPSFVRIQGERTSKKTHAESKANESIWRRLLCSIVAFLPSRLFHFSTPIFL